jgi:hypothetical protein
MRRYLRRCIIAFSIFVNVVGGGRSNQTFSATQYERKKQKRFNVAWLIDLFFFWEKDHCMDAWVKWKLIHKSIRHFENLGETFYDTITHKQYIEYIEEDETKSTWT